MSKLEYRRLDEAEIVFELNSISGWERRNDHLGKQFEFKEYQEGLVFATAVGFLSDTLNHHPDISISYRKVDVQMTTHATKCLSPYDFELARRIDAISRTS